MPNYAEKLAAEKAAMQVRVVKGIATEIEVRIAGPHQKNDTEIAEAVTRALSWHVWTPDTVKAIVRKGLVTLTGEAQNDYQRQSASNCVRLLSGVTGVTNDIEVETKSYLMKLKEEIEKPLVRDAELEAKNVHVDANDGTVTLSGNVHSYFETQAAGSAAWRASGVREVRNNLLVGQMTNNSIQPERRRTIRPTTRRLRLGHASNRLPTHIFSGTRRGKGVMNR